MRCASIDSTDSSGPGGEGSTANGPGLVELIDVWGVQPVSIVVGERLPDICTVLEETENAGLSARRNDALSWRKSKDPSRPRTPESSLVRAACEK